MLLSMAELSAEEHQRLVDFIAKLMVDDPPLDSPEGTALLTLALVVGEYEHKHYPFDAAPPSPVTALTPHARANEFMSAIANEHDSIGDAITAMLPEKACFCLFVTDGEDGPGLAATVSNISREAVASLVHAWAEALSEGTTQSLEGEQPSKH